MVNTVQGEDESDEELLSFTQRTADSSFWDWVLTEQLSISECFSTAMKAVFKATGHLSFNVNGQGQNFYSKC